MKTMTEQANVPEAPIYNKYGEPVILSDAVCRLCGQRVGLNTNAIVNPKNEVVCEHCWSPSDSRTRAEISLSAHTPGPWHLGCRDSSDPVRAEIDINAYYESECGTTSRCVGTAFGEANARLFAAAPDLLSVLDVLVEEVSLSDSPSRGIIERAAEVVRKAKGE